MKNKKYNSENIQFLLMGFILMVTAVLRLEDYPVAGFFLLGLGFALFSYFLYGVKFKKKNLQLQIIGYFVEAVGLIFTAYIYFEEEKVIIPYMFLLAAVGFFLAAIVSLRRIRKRKIKKIDFSSDKNIA